MTVAVARAELDAEARRLGAIHQRATTLDPGAYLSPLVADRLRHELTEPLRELLAQAIERLGWLQEVCDARAPADDEWGAHVESTGEREAVGVGATLSTELWQAVGNTVFAARSELRQAQRNLAAAGDSDERAVVACEAARRKLRRGLQAVLGALEPALDARYELVGADGEIEATIAVRRLFARFRRSVPMVDVDDPTAVRRALRLSAVALAVMVGSVDFSEVRVQDRQLLLRLQRRIVGWARDGASEAAGRQLYQDLQTSADLLRAINRRQELIAHDRRQLAHLAATLAGPPPPLVRVLAATRALVGLDDELDRLVGQLRDERALEARLGTLRVVIDGLRAG